MDVASIVGWVEQSPVGEAYRSSGTMLGLVQSLHFLGTCLLFGSLLIVDLRLLGVGRIVPVQSTTVFIPMAITGLALNIATGIVMMSADQVSNPALQIKLVLVVLGVINALWVTFGVQREALSSSRGAVISVPTQWGAGISLVLWTGVIVLGRLIPTFE